MHGITGTRRRYIRRSPSNPHRECCSQALDVWFPDKPSEEWFDMNTRKYFIRDKIKYRCGDFVYVANSITICQHDDTENILEKNRSDHWVAQIIEIKASESDTYALVCWMYSPDDLPRVTVGGGKFVSGRQRYHGEKELIASNHRDVIDFKSVENHATVHPWELDDSGIQNGRHWRQALNCLTWQLSWVHITSLWQDSEQNPLIFPSEGKNRVTIKKTEINRLNERELLNDELINFYTCYLKTKFSMLRKVYFFSSFFYPNLLAEGDINYELVKKWTKGVDLFSYNYIVIPIFENNHWYLAIICNTPNAIRHSSGEHGGRISSTASLQSVTGLIDTTNSPSMAIGERQLVDTLLEHGTTATAVTTTEMIQGHVDGTASSMSQVSPPRVDLKPSKLDAKPPIIVIFDSLGYPRARTCQVLNHYLFEEAKAKKGVDLVSIPTNMVARGIPKQNNILDCGAFLIGNMVEFLKHPGEVVRKILLKEELGWKFSAAEIRAHVRDILCELRAEQLAVGSKGKKEASQKEVHGQY
ncbi:hypothetical protein GGI35DRAFT_205515 [Trichoderma velutinum]